MLFLLLMMLMNSRRVDPILIQNVPRIDVLLDDWAIQSAM